MEKVTKFITENQVYISIALVLGTAVIAYKVFLHGKR